MDITEVAINLLKDRTCNQCWWGCNDCDDELYNEIPLPKHLVCKHFEEDEHHINDTIYCGRESSIKSLLKSYKKFKNQKKSKVIWDLLQPKLKDEDAKLLEKNFIKYVNSIISKY